MSKLAVIIMPANDIILCQGVCRHKDGLIYSSYMYGTGAWRGDSLWRYMVSCTLVNIGSGNDWRHQAISKLIC